MKDLGAAALAAALSLSVMQAAPAAAVPLVIGETFRVASRVLGEERVINVYVPPGYAASPDARVPVLYMVDGGWDDGQLVREAEARLKIGPRDGRWLWFASSNAEGMASDAQRLADALDKGAPTGLHWHYQPMPGEQHSTIYHPAALLAFRKVFAPAGSAP